MTINQLHKLTGKLLKEGHGRRRVAVNKRSFTHPLEGDGVAYIEVDKAIIQTVPMIDDDGGIAVTARGRERNLTYLVMDGGNDPSFDDE